MRVLREMEQQGMSSKTFLIMLNSLLFGAIITSIIVNVKEIKKIDRSLYGKKVKKKWSNRV